MMTWRICFLGIIALISWGCGAESASKAPSTPQPEMAPISRVAETVGIQVHSPRVRILPDAAAIYGTVMTDGAEDRLMGLVGVTESGEEFEIVLHETYIEGEIMGMRDRPDGFPLTSENPVVFEPGGSHGMVMGTALDPEAENLRLRWLFEKSEPVETLARVMTLDEIVPAESHEGHSM